MSRKLQIFVSSTYTDLRAERQAAVEAILKAGHIPAGMELFSAGDESQVEVIKRWIDDSDVYMLILGGRYGSIHQPSGISYVELEYDYAIYVNKPVFSTVMTDAALDARTRTLGKDALELEHPDKFKTFRSKVMSRICSFFDDHKDIKLAIHETLADFQRRHSLVGWMRADKFDALDDIARDLSHANKKKRRAAKRSKFAKQTT